MFLFQTHGFIYSGVRLRLIKDVPFTGGGLMVSQDCTQVIL